MKRIDEVAEELVAGPHRVVSTDLFDTVLLRDQTTEVVRLAETAHRAAALLDVDADMLARLRWRFQEIAYRTVTAERPDGEASLQTICSSMARLLGRGAAGAEILQRTEVAVDIAHLRVHRDVLRVLQRAAKEGKRVIAVSDTYYATSDLHTMLARVVGSNPISMIYSSADVGLTKHTGGLYWEVARREDVEGGMIMHIGDNYTVDVEMAEAACWNARHVPRGRRHEVARTVGKVRALPDAWRRRR